jgi:acetolactate synthase-1/2/3 large subunit
MAEPGLKRAMPTGAELFVDSIGKLGISTIFTLVGDHLNEVLSVASKRGIRIVDMRHESGVTHAADAWGRIHRTPGLSLVTGGPGHTNSLTGIATAYQACSPLIAVSGAPPAASAGRQVFQVIDQVGMAAPVVKWAAQPAGAAQIPYYLGRAYAEAMTGRMPWRAGWSPIIGATRWDTPTLRSTRRSTRPSPRPTSCSCSASASTTAWR